MDDRQMTAAPRPDCENNWQDMVHWGDCLDVMRSSIPDNSIDLIVTSPPYANARSHTYGGIAPELYVDWFCERADEMLRILKPTGSFVLNIKEKAVDGERHTYVLDLILALKRETGFRWVEEYIWHKTTAAPGKWKYRFRDSWERILHFSRTRDFKMNQDAVKVPVGDWKTRRLANMSENDLSRQESATQSKVGRRIANWQDRDMVYPTNVLHRSPVAHNTGHSAAFPEWLPEFFIKLLTDERDIVLDPFLGSGTTFRVARRLGRVPVGIELDPNTCIDTGQNELLLDF
ncbi:MAG: site-specific DNA-methyltransferase [Anaerolineaceae bacterium]|nr:site-specific DNA-methyltransferase [Anaerolineaceae bacterium]